MEGKRDRGIVTVREGEKEQIGKEKHKREDTDNFCLQANGGSNAAEHSTPPK